jgi:hypothetical protein
VPHEVSQTSNRIVFVMSGVVDDAEFTESAEELREILNDDRELDELVDLTAVEQFAVTPATLRSVSANHPCLVRGPCKSLLLRIEPLSGCCGCIRS